MSAAGRSVRIRATTHDRAVACPTCGFASRRVHSRYERRLSDLMVGGRETVIHLRVRRLFCGNEHCARATFVEQVAGLTIRHGRRSVGLGRMLERIALALGGRAGARLTSHVAVDVSRMTLLRLVRALPDPPAGVVRVLGVDDFALRRGHVYGTVLVDIESGRPVDVLDDRTAGTLTTWLREHPGVEIVCRDRAGAYAEGARLGAPQALQVADRWHVWNNLATAVERTVARHRACLRPPEDATSAIDAPTGAPPPASTTAPGVMRTDRIAVRTRERYAAVHRLRGKGLGVRAIVAELGLAKGTVRRFVRASGVDELLTNDGTGRRPSLLEEFKPYLHRRWTAGCTNATLLFEEIKARGYRGRYQIVRDYLRPFRTGAPVHEPTPPAPKVRRVASWIMSNPRNMTNDDQRRLDEILTRSPELIALAGHVRSFATMMCDLRGERLEEWTAAVENDDLPALHSFVTGLRRDQDAVTAGLTLPWNSGRVEGHVNRIKMIKRQMYGRANPDLLRKRILLAD
ncbi:ISL3 family transposase [Saccharothrix sp. CB00851]|uniref:ISL3 family transposase n=1 Tax=Saccharothrix sp. CB00851 TaxID=1835005 RepID=UPI002378F828|nr:ISL3 family transposase [Saccharothrix sp. CB00851]